MDQAPCKNVVHNIQLNFILKAFMKDFREGVGELAWKGEVTVNFL